MLIKKDPDLIASYLSDYSNISGGFCDSIILPENEKDVSEILTQASKDNTPITISAAGTGVTGARIPFGGHVLSLEKMDKIVYIKDISNTEGEALLEPGVILQNFLQNLESKGFFYPPDPTEKGSFLGGNVATSASGARSFRFGTTRDFVKGLKIILATGERLEIGRGSIYAGNGRILKLPLASGGTIEIRLPKYNMPEVKNAAGYYIKDEMDAIDLFIGGEGTLGVITGIRLKLLKQGPRLLDCYAFFNAEEQAMEFVRKARSLSLVNRIHPDAVNAISLEFFDENALNMLREKHKNIPRGMAAAVYFQQELAEICESAVLDAWSSLITECGGSLDMTWFAQSKKEQKELADIRHDLPDMVNDYIKRKRLTKVGTDIAVRHERLDDMLKFYKGLLSDAGFDYVMFGHIGDSHLHVNILPKDANQHQKAKAIYDKFVKKAVSLGGTVSAEHGIGKLKHRYLEMMYGKKAIAEMASLKKSLDPSCILGLDNIFPKELLK